MRLLAWMLLFFAVATGCKVSTGVFIEKDWVVDESMARPDLRTKYEIRMSRDFNSWDEVWMIHPKDDECPGQ